MIFEDKVMRHKLVGGKQEASICRCYMVQSRKCMYLCICSSIFDTVEDCSRTGCGLETDRVWLSLSVCACVCSSFFLSLSEAEWKGTQIKAVYFLLREEKGEWAALLCPPLRSLPPECQAHEWLRGGGGGGRRGRMGGTAMFCVNPSASVPWARLWRSPGVCFGFHAQPPMPGFQQMWRQLGPNSVYVLGHRRGYK